MTRAEREMGAAREAAAAALEVARDAGYGDGYDLGLKHGVLDGRAAAQNEDVAGKEATRKVGFAEGYDSGCEDGYAKARAELLDLKGALEEAEVARRVAYGRGYEAGVLGATAPAAACPPSLEVTPKGGVYMWVSGDDGKVTREEATLTLDDNNWEVYADRPEFTGCRPRVFSQQEGAREWRTERLLAAADAAQAKADELRAQLDGLGIVGGCTRIGGYIPPGGFCAVVRDEPYRDGGGNGEDS